MRPTHPTPHSISTAHRNQQSDLTPLTHVVCVPPACCAAQQAWSPLQQLAPLLLQVQQRWCAGARQQVQMRAAHPCGLQLAPHLHLYQLLLPLLLQCRQAQQVRPPAMAPTHGLKDSKPQQQVTAIQRLHSSAIGGGAWECGCALHIAKLHKMRCNSYESLPWPN
jgi:hypothetical protein